MLIIHEEYCHNYREGQLSPDETAEVRLGFCCHEHCGVCYVSGDKAVYAEFEVAVPQGDWVPVTREGKTWAIEAVCRHHRDELHMEVSQLYWRDLETGQANVERWYWNIARRVRKRRSRAEQRRGRVGG